MNSLNFKPLTQVIWQSNINDGIRNQISQQELYANISVETEKKRKCYQKIKLEVSSNKIHSATPPSQRKMWTFSSKHHMEKAFCSPSRLYIRDIYYQEIYIIMRRDVYFNWGDVYFYLAAFR